MLLAQGQYAPAEPESSQTQCIAEFEHVIDLLKFIHAKDLYRVKDLRCVAPRAFHVYNSGALCATS